MKNEKGISLIALIIVIVILIVLAIVTVYLVVGPDGVLESQQISEQTNEEIYAENVLLAALTDLNASYNEEEETEENITEEAEEDITEGTEKESENSLQTRLEGLTAEFLTEFRSDYEYQVEDSTTTTGKIVTMTKGEYTFKALVTESLSVYEFKRISGGIDTETFESK